MLYREIIAVCSVIHTKHINTLCGQNVEFCNVIFISHLYYVYFIFMYMHNNHCHRVTAHLQVNILLLL